MIKLIFVTGNQKKLEQAKQALSDYDIQLTNQKIETPEIQETDVKKIAEFSAKYAANAINKPVVVTDAGYYINALNGFPGPFIKFVNQWFKPEDLLRLMSGVTDRSVSSSVCVAYCEPNKEPVSFISDNQGILAEAPQGEGPTIDQLYIPNGYNSPIGTLDENERLTLWNMDCWKQLADYLTKQNSPALNNGV
ncbi:MAG: hypothetical protein UR98_C0018G0007 [Parcubacteria group bacterium GW2011_GWA1_36_12]|nr:MAG: hypothetical protein UR98_C0018G0007 [Parcubacteria group bacterium GW2011_GWA1_36_12]